MRGLDRSQRREVRNPVLGLPAARRLQALPPEEAKYHMQRCIDSGLWVPG